MNVSRTNNLTRCTLAWAVLLLAIGANLGSASAEGTWTMAPVNPATGGQAFGLWLLTDGTVLSHGSALNNWVILTPDKTGSYAKGTWKKVASSEHARGGATQHVLKDGRFFQAGGEYVDGPQCTPDLCKGAEIYDPIKDEWKAVAPGIYEIADTGSATLADGRLLYSCRKTKQTQIYDPTTDKWTAGSPLALANGDENSWATLQNGGVLAVGYKSDGAAIFDPATGNWIRTGPVPSGFATGDTGGISLMFDGRVLVYGLGTMYIYTPGPTAADPGTWALGPKALMGYMAEDEYSNTLPNGKVWGGLVQRTYGPGVILQEFDPTTDSVKSVTPPPDKGNPFPIDYVNLPNGQVMVTSEQNDWIYTPDSEPQDEWRPTVTSVVVDSGTTYTLSGTQLSGLINGADEGDDMTMAENYPIVWLKDKSDNVYYARSFNFSSMAPIKGDMPQTCQFTTPAGLPEGSYDLYVSAVGVKSKDAYPFTTGTGGPPLTPGKPSGAAGSSAAGSGGAGSDAPATGDAPGGDAPAGVAGRRAPGSVGVAAIGGSGGRSAVAAGGAPAVGVAGGGGSQAPRETDKPSDGCGCRVVAAGSMAHGAWPAAILGALAWLRLRRRRRTVG